MTTLATCSFGAYRPTMGIGVRITLGAPRTLPPGRWRWPYLAELAPRPWYFRAAPEKFGRMYLAQLERFADDILTKLGWLTAEYGPCTLLCFERRVSGPTDCHRRAAAGWLQDRLGIEIPELDPATKSGQAARR
jgi:hypothetical protein